MIGLSIASVLACFSCSSDRNGTENTETVEIAPERREVKIVYDSPEADSAPKYAEGDKQEGPLGLLDLDYPNKTVTEGTCDVGAWKLDGTPQLTIWFTNPTEDTVRVAALHLPDHRFEAVWEGMPEYCPGLSCGFKLTADSVEYIEDYRIVLEYLDNQYPPQIFHLNIHPDLIKLRQSKGLM